jgi:hypothetical protein
VEPIDISMDADEEEDDNESINNVDDKADGMMKDILQMPM